MWLSIGRAASLALVAMIAAIGMAGQGGAQQSQAAGGQSAAWKQCSARLDLASAARLARISAAVKPSETQRPAFEALTAASARAVEALRATCPTDTPESLTDGLAASQKRAQARLEAITIARAAVESFRQVLDDKQKAALDNLGKDRSMAEWGEPLRSTGRSVFGSNGTRLPWQGRFCFGNACLDCRDNRCEIVAPNERPIPESHWRDQQNFGRVWRE